MSASGYAAEEAVLKTTASGLWQKLAFRNEIPEAEMVALLNINMKIAQRLMNTKNNSKSH